MRGESYLGFVIKTVNSGEYELLLEMGTQVDVTLVFTHLGALILADHSSAGAGGVQEDSVKATHDLGQLPSVVIADDRVGNPEPIDITRWSVLNNHCRSGSSIQVT